MTNYAQIQIPDKYDIIPIHQSDTAAFKRCRRYWDWSSPARHSLTIRADVMGINTNLWFGTGIHWALEQFRNPIVSRDPVEAWKTWFDIQWTGGIVDEYWLDLVYDLNPRPLGKQTPTGYLGEGWDDVGEEVELWEVRGLDDILPDPDHHEYDELRELGINMMEFYKTYAAKHDDFEVIACEHTFSVPIWDYADNCIMRAIDTREQSPNFGKLLEVHARGRMDTIYYKPDRDVYGVIDYKTADKIGDEYFRKLEADEQTTRYLWAAEVEASYYGLDNAGKPLEEVIFEALRKRYPKPPTEVRGGMFSVNREQESCTYEMLQDWIARNMPGVPLNEKQQAYSDWLRDVGDEQFVVRQFVRRNRHQLKNAGERLWLEARDMLSDPLIYPNITNDFRCMNCQFRVPCLAKEDGSDYEDILHNNYAINKDR